MKKVLVVGAFALLVGAPFAAAPVLGRVLLGGINSAGGVAAPAISAGMLALYRAAAAACPGLDWRVLAAIGTVESDNGTSPLPGVHSGQNPAGAEGPMQFEPASFLEYARPVPPGGADPPSPYDPVDAVYAAARMLCANGAGAVSGVAGAVFAYNHSDSYVQRVLQLAGSLTETPQVDDIPARGGLLAAGFALAQVGTPYRWGAELPGYGFDCSGLAQAAWAAAGVRVPRVAQAQYDAGPLVAPGVALLPGDLVFFGAGDGSVSHVGVVVGSGLMVDAPHAGSTVRVEPFRATIGASWGSDVYVGAVRPSG